jgi:hypothetical protein
MYKQFKQHNNNLKQSSIIPLFSIANPFNSSVYYQHFTIIYQILLTKNSLSRIDYFFSNIQHTRLFCNIPDNQLNNETINPQKNN